MDDGVSADSQEAQAVGEPAEHGLEELEEAHAYHHAHAHALLVMAEMEPYPERLAEPYREQQHGKDYPVHSAGEHGYLEQHGERHARDEQRYEEHAGDAVGGEERPAVIPLAEAGEDIEHPAEQYQHDADDRADKEYRDDAVALEHLEAGEQVLVAEHAAVYKAEYDGGYANRGEDPAEPHAALLIHVQPHEYEYYALADVAEHHAEEQTVRKREEQPRVGLAIGRNAVHVNERGKDLCQLAFLELDGYPARIVRAGLLKAAGAAQGVRGGLEIRLAALRHPAAHIEGFALDADHAAERHALALILEPGVARKQLV